MSPRRPEAPDRADVAACRALLCGGSRSFHAASLLLPRRLRQEAAVLYAFCREADDAIDEGAEPQAALAALHRRLDRVYADRPGDSPVDRALARVVITRDIPMSLLLALLEGFAWDAEGRRYRDLDALTDYAMRVAGCVGLMMALLMGRRDAHTLARAADLGVAMQFTNIARDVGQDARAGRLYLPLDWLRQSGIEPAAWLAAPEFNRPLAGVVGRLLQEAERLYRRADCGIARLPLSCRPAIYTARRLYAGIGDALAARGCDSVSTRTVLSTGERLGRLAQAPAVLWLPQAELRAPPLPGARAWVESLADGRPASEGIGWVLELFAELEQRDRQLVGASSAGR